MKLSLIISLLALVLAKVDLLTCQECVAKDFVWQVVAMNNYFGTVSVSCEKGCPYELHKTFAASMCYRDCSAIINPGVETSADLLKAGTYKYATDACPLKTKCSECTTDSRCDWVKSSKVATPKDVGCLAKDIIMNFGDMEKITC